MIHQGWQCFCRDWEWSTNNQQWQTWIDDGNWFLIGYWLIQEYTNQVVAGLHFPRTNRRCNTYWITIAHLQALIHPSHLLWITWCQAIILVPFCQVLFLRGAIHFLETAWKSHPKQLTFSSESKGFLMVLPISLDLLFRIYLVLAGCLIKKIYKTHIFMYRCSFISTKILHIYRIHDIIGSKGHWLVRWFSLLETNVDPSKGVRKLIIQRLGSTVPEFGDIRGWSASVVIGSSPNGNHGSSRHNHGIPSAPTIDFRQQHSPGRWSHVHGPMDQEPNARCRAEWRFCGGPCKWWCGYCQYLPVAPVV